MVCPSCGKQTSFAGPRCAACETVFAVSSQAAVGALTPPADLGAETIAPGAVTYGGGETLGPARVTEGETFAPDTTGLPPSARGVRHVRRAEGGPLETGQSFGPRYHIIKLLGVGGMGAVYQAWDSELGLAVALKVIRPEATADARAAADLERRFKNELLLARQVTHKHVVRIHDLGEIDGIKYITMGFVEGDDLATIIPREGTLGLARSLKLARQIAAGLEAAHEAGVVHRDLKPPNIMVSAAGGDDQALIMDFGIARSTAGPDRGAAVGSIVGTLEYMAPEQARGGVVDQRADIYAFGLILYEMLVGRRKPSGTESALDAMKARIETGVPNLRSISTEIPETVDQVVARCLEIDPAKRYQTSTELLAALNRIDDQGELIPEPRRLTRRMLVAAAALVVVALVGTFILTRRAVLPPVQHDPVSVVIADFVNGTGDSAFDRTLEPMLKRALEGAGFISAFDRDAIRRTLGVRPPEKLDEVAARGLAVKQGVGVVLAGSVDLQGSSYRISVRATETVTGNEIASAQGSASSKDQVLVVATRLIARVRNALGDEASESAQMFAMASVSATSLEVVRHWVAGREAATNNKYDEAQRSYSKAVELDPKFGLGYQGLANVSQNLANQQDAEKYIKEALRYVTGMTERERYTTRGGFYRVTGDYRQCVKEYGDLLASYPADIAAHNNLAICWANLRNFTKALDELRRVVAILPNRALYRVNLASYANFSTEFETGEREARTIQEPDVNALVAVAFAQLGQGHLTQAMETYQKLATINAYGASLAASGLGDLANLEGRFSDAARILAQGAAEDLTSKRPDWAAAKFAALAHTELLRGQKRAAIAAGEKALMNSSGLNVQFMAARAFVEAGEAGRARPLIAALASELLAEPQAYAKIVEGELALKNGDPRQAIEVLTQANTLLDTWLGHFDLGRAYFEAEQFTQADSEFERCLKRRGEALQLILGDEPTYAYLPPVYYYQGRVRDGLKSDGTADSYREYLKFRGGKSSEDPLLKEVRQRAGR